MRVLTSLLRFVQYTSMKYGIDESHALGHSMDVLHYTHQIYLQQRVISPQLVEQEPVFYSAAILHDMYDHKYENKNIPPISNVLQYHLKPHEINAVTNIINTMSLSQVKKNGFPYLQDYQWAYHIVREADLLASYDMDRAMIYHMYHSKNDVFSSYENTLALFETRVNNYYKDNLFMTEYGKAKGHELLEKSIVQLANWKSIIQSYDRYI
jgi:HD superfamily phosphodiesterase